MAADRVGLKLSSGSGSLHFDFIAKVLWPDALPDGYETEKAGMVWTRQKER